MSREFYKDANPERPKTLGELLFLSPEVKSFVMNAGILKRLNPDELVKSVLTSKNITVGFTQAGEEGEAAPTLTSTSGSNPLIVFAATETYGWLKKFFQQDEYQEIWEARVELLAYPRNDDCSVSSFDRLMGSYLAREYLRWVDAGREEEPEAKELLFAVEERGLQNPTDPSAMVTAILTHYCAVM